MSTLAKRKQNRLTLKRGMTILKKHMPDLAARYQVKTLGVFGSYARNEQTRRSDIDILVDFSETPDLFQFMDLFAQGHQRAWEGQASERR